VSYLRVVIRLYFDRFFEGDWGEFVGIGCESGDSKRDFWWFSSDIVEES
jgi:hypothetical protein